MMRPALHTQNLSVVLDAFFSLILPPLLISPQILSSTRGVL